MPIANEGDAYYKGTTPVTRIYAGDIEVWPMLDDIVLTVTSNRWDRQTVSWNNVGEVENYILYKDGVEVKRHPTDLSYLATGLSPLTSYTWRIEAIKFGVVKKTDTETFSTIAYADPALVGSSPAWWCNDLSWTDSTQGSVDWYKLYSGSTVIMDRAASSGKTFRHQNLLPSTPYSYKLECIRGGTSGTVIKTDTVSVTSGGRTLSLSGYAAAWNNNRLDWTDSDGSTLTEYHLWRDGVGYTWISPGARSYNDTGVGENQYHTYQIQGHRSGVLIAPASNVIGITTPARPTSTGYAKTGYTRISSGGWTQSTQCNPSGGNLSFPVGGTMTSMTLAAWGYSGSNARIRPYVGGVARQDSIVGPGTNSTSTWNTIPINVGFGAASHSVGMRTGGSDPANGISDFGRCEWDTWSPYSDYKTQVYIDGINYWFYSGREAVDDMRRTPWWREELAEPVETRSLHIETTNDPVSGEFLTAVITDKETGEVLVDWGMRPVPAEEIPEAPET